MTTRGELRIGECYVGISNGVPTVVYPTRPRDLPAHWNYSSDGLPGAMYNADVMTTRVVLLEHYLTHPAGVARPEMVQPQISPSVAWQGKVEHYEYARGQGWVRKAGLPNLKITITSGTGAGAGFVRQAAAPQNFGTPWSGWAQPLPRQVMRWEFEDAQDHDDIQRERMAALQRELDLAGDRIRGNAGERARGFLAAERDRLAIEQDRVAAESDRLAIDDLSVTPTTAADPATGEPAVRTAVQSRVSMDDLSGLSQEYRWVARTPRQIPRRRRNP